ncbi:MAG: DUF1573 domain-containing protein [Planctomycetales bacterium]|nr:DUF1573 domain-containing protein [Planctomycetales bacterium]
MFPRSACWVFTTITLIVGCIRTSFPEVFSIKLANVAPRVAQQVTIPVLNPYNEPLSLSSFMPSCSCSTPIFESKTIAAGDRVEVLVTLSTAQIAKTFGSNGSVTLTPMFSGEGSSSVPGVPIEIDFQFHDLIQSPINKLQLIAGSNSDSIEIKYRSPVTKLHCVESPEGCQVVLRNVDEQRSRSKMTVSIAGDARTFESPIILRGVDDYGRTIAESLIDLRVLGSSGLWVVDDHLESDRDTLQTSVQIFGPDCQNIARVSCDLSEFPKVRLDNIAFNARTQRVELRVVREAGSLADETISIPLTFVMNNGKEELIDLYLVFTEQLR